LAHAASTQKVANAAYMSGKMYKQQCFASEDVNYKVRPQHKMLSSFIDKPSQHQRFSKLLQAKTRQPDKKAYLSRILGRAPAKKTLS
jgi:hypothetical protein